MTFFVGGSENTAIYSWLRKGLKNWWQGRGGLVAPNFLFAQTHTPSHTRTHTHTHTHLHSCAHTNAHLHAHSRPKSRMLQFAFSAGASSLRALSLIGVQLTDRMVCPAIKSVAGMPILAPSLVTLLVAQGVTRFEKKCCYVPCSHYSLRRHMHVASRLRCVTLRLASVYLWDTVKCIFSK